jgi:hypothetical protein
VVTFLYYSSTPKSVDKVDNMAGIDDMDWKLEPFGPFGPLIMNAPVHASAIRSDGILECWSTGKGFSGNG